MSFFNNFVSSAKKAVDTVGKGAGSMIDTGKLKMNASELKNEMKKSYEALGKLVYQSKIDGTDVSAQIDLAVVDINDMKEKIAEIEMELMKISGKIYCGNCGEVNSTESSFCCKCGVKLEQEIIEEANAEVVEDTTE